MPTSFPVRPVSNQGLAAEGRLPRADVGRCVVSNLGEDAARDALVAYGARLYGRGLVAGPSGNLSVRLADGSLVVTPAGVSLGRLAPPDLVRCGPRGEPLGPGRPTSELPLHLAAYRARADATCVVHTHPTYCIAWSKTGGLFPLDTVGALESLGSVAFTRYARSGSRELAEVCAAAFAGSDTLVMERHGLACLAGDLETAFARTDLAEQTAQIEFAAFLLGASKRPGMQNRPALPVDDLWAAAGEHAEARDAVTAFQAEYSAEAPDAQRLGAHAEHLRRYPAVVAPFERWWLEPRVQAFLAELTGTGL